MKLVLVTPRVSEKAYRLVTNENTYILISVQFSDRNHVRASYNVKKPPGKSA